MSTTPEQLVHSADIEPPLARLAPPAQRSITARYVVVFLVSAINIAAAIIVSSGICSYGAGRHNENPPFIFTRMEATLVAGWLLTFLGMMAAAFLIRGPVRAAAIGSVFVCLVALPISCQTREHPDERYENGFLEWTAGNVQASVIRQWQATLPSVAVTTPIPPAQWPPAVTSLAPTAVEHLPTQQGVVLQWGRLAAWGTSRKVFIANDPATASPPVDWHHRWKTASDGVYAAVQIPG